MANPTPTPRASYGLEIFTVRMRRITRADGVNDELLEEETTEYVKREDYERELAATRETLASKSNLLKTLCDEWNDDCEPECDSIAHAEDCGATNMIEAMKKRRLRYEQAEQQLAEMEKDAERYRCYRVQNPPPTCLQFASPEQRDAFYDAAIAQEKKK